MNKKLIIFCVLLGTQQLFGIAGRAGGGGFRGGGSVGRGSMGSMGRPAQMARPATRPAYNRPAVSQRPAYQRPAMGTMPSYARPAGGARPVQPIRPPRPLGPGGVQPGMGQRPNIPGRGMGGATRPAQLPARGGVTRPSQLPARFNKLQQAAKDIGQTHRIDPTRTSQSGRFSQFRTPERLSQQRAALNRSWKGYSWNWWWNNRRPYFLAYFPLWFNGQYGYYPPIYYDYYDTYGDYPTDQSIADYYASYDPAYDYPPESYPPEYADQMQQMQMMQMMQAMNQQQQYSQEEQNPQVTIIDLRKQSPQEQMYPQELTGEYMRPEAEQSAFLPDADTF